MAKPINEVKGNGDEDDLRSRRERGCEIAPEKITKRKRDISSQKSSICRASERSEEASVKAKSLCDEIRLVHSISLLNQCLITFCEGISVPENG